MAGSRITNNELDERVEKAYHLRYDDNLTQVQYVAWAKEEYGDKSEQQYCQYFQKAKELYSERWRDRLNKLLDPAIDELTRLLVSEDEKVKQRAIDQVMKFTGNDVTKIEADIKEKVTVSFGNTEESS